MEETDKNRIDYLINTEIYKDDTTYIKMMRLKRDPFFQQSLFGLPPLDTQANKPSEFCSWIVKISGTSACGPHPIQCTNE